MDLNEDRTISQYISDFGGRDIDSYSFYDLLNPFLNQFNQNELYQLAENCNDLVTISDERPYPNIILNAITPFVTRVYFGVLSMLSKFYCIIDNSVYFWPTDLNAANDKDVEYYVEEESTMISCVSCGPINQNVFKKTATIGVIIYGTDILVKIIPVTEKFISFESSIKVYLKFIPTDFYASKNGTIFISSIDGYIYSLKYSLNEYTGKCDAKIENLTKNKYLWFLPNIFSMSSRIVQMVVDEDSQILAALNGDSILKFYKIDGDKMDLISEFDPREVDETFKSSIQSIVACPLNDSSSIKFIGFYEDGTRICFFVDKFLDLVNRSTIHEPPPIGDADIFFSGFLSPSYCIFLYERSIVIARESHDSSGVRYSTKETYIVIPFDSDVLSFSQKIPNIQPTKLVNHPFYWQHLFLPSPGYLMTSKGIRTINFLTPMDILSKIFKDEIENRVFMSDPLKKFASINFLETAATAVLLAIKQPEYKDRCFRFIIKAIQAAEASRQDTDQHFYTVFPFYIRISRILSPIMPYSIFKCVNDDEYEFSEGFKNPSLDYVNEINQIKSLCDDYYKYFTRLNYPKTPDIDTFPSISTYLSTIIEILQLIKILTEIENGLISKILDKMDINHRQRLEASEFGYESNSCQSKQNNEKNDFAKSLCESLRDFIMQLYEINPKSEIFYTIEQKCPRFFNRSDIIVLNSIKVIKEAFDNSDGQISNAAEFLIKNVSRQMDLEDICSILSSKRCFNYAFKLCMAKVDFLDPKKLSYHWFIFDRSITNSPGKDKFDEIYKFYEIIYNVVNLDIDDDINIIINTNDEMLHFCFYKHLLDNKKLKKILSKETPYLKKFIINEAPYYLWRYLAAHKEYDKAAIEIWKYINDDENVDITLQKRIKLLKKAIRYTIESNTLKNDLKTALRLGEIQMDLLNRTEDNYEYIMSPRDLFIECYTNQFWDLALRCLSYSSFEVEKKLVISQIWEYFIVQYLYGASLSDCSATLQQLFTFLDINSDIAKLEIILPLFENFKIYKKAQNYWVIKLLIKVGYNISSLVKIYYHLYNDQSLQDEIKYTYIDIIGFALSKGALLERAKVMDLKNWFYENASSYQDYDSVLQTFNAIL
ncbi:hypothetical protein M9Y10_010029 [Tritrichomonas musculus]|uniref:Nucleoporin Nup133/Nup155-like N-terminal domain-containing protein n=1 Tax=Tritrichomonas musculus TaxID=1915356 RepID=A0ABR2IR29_9EUKA